MEIDVSFDFDEKCVIITVSYPKTEASTCSQSVAQLKQAAVSRACW